MEASSQKAVQLQFMVGLAANGDPPGWFWGLVRRYRAKKRTHLALKLVRSFYSAFSYCRIRGYWHGQAEPSLWISVWDQTSLENALKKGRSLARRLGEILGQEAVVLAVIETSFELVEPPSKSIRQESENFARI
ncbi:MAG: hypothetical protein DWQ01_15930 [Planctomycetota bacterium]|nr:MAG: hypothetical protein DWQ01_15930 [Planctomycetota bacterium]